MTQRRDTMGVYVHFPWCLAKCPYCDFVSYSSASSEIEHSAYADAIVREADARAALFAERKLDTIFFGGGTPSLWDPKQVGRIVQHLRALFVVATDDMEVTVECNPTSLDEDRARALLDAGVNRLSIGVQSLDERRLAFLGRLHNPDGAIGAIRSAQRARIRRVSADLIFGLPEQSAAEATGEALDLLDLGLEHLSCYELTIEPGTRFGQLARRGRLPLAKEDEVVESFMAIDEALTTRGLRHYEVSNYARLGNEARHNLGYWRGHEYLGLGCAAVGFRRLHNGVTRGIRYRNRTQPDRYVKGLTEGVRNALGDIEEASESLDAVTLLRERIMLGLRVDEGVDIEGAANALSTPGWTARRARAATWLQERGRIVREGKCVRIPPAAWVWTNDTVARLL
jgi:putative oxygen-independent coproporphyrinogen III oxidase